jgi:hypothetical protein
MSGGEDDREQAVLWNEAQARDGLFCSDAPDPKATAHDRSTLVFDGPGRIPEREKSRGKCFSRVVN